MSRATRPDRAGSERKLTSPTTLASAFQQPHVELAVLDRSNHFNVLQRLQIWNNGYGFAYPSLATNACTREVGLSLEYGGPSDFQNHVVGFWGDFVLYVTTDSNVGTTRFGDYVTIRQRPATRNHPGNLFDAFGYGLDAPPPPAWPPAPGPTSTTSCSAARPATDRSRPCSVATAARGGEHRPGYRVVALRGNVFLSSGRQSPLGRNAAQ